MLMNLKNFHLTQIPDKTNDMIFLRSPKTLFWVIFDHFWPIGMFSKKSKKILGGPINTSDAMVVVLKDILLWLLGLGSYI